MKQNHIAYMYADHLPSDITFEEVVGAYNGRRGECACGCAGDYFGVNNRYVAEKDKDPEVEKKGMWTAYRRLVNHISKDNKAIVFVEQEDGKEVIRYCIDVNTRTYFVTFRLDERGFKN